MAIVTNRLSINQYKIGFAPDFSAANQMYALDSTYRLIFLTADIGYVLCGRELLPSPVGNGYLDSVTYDSATDELQVVAAPSIPGGNTEHYYLEDFELKLSQQSHFGIDRAGLTGAHQWLRGYEYNHATNTTDPLPIGDITEFFGLMREYCAKAKLDNGHAVAESSFKSFARAEVAADGMDGAVYDEDAVEDFMATENGRKLIGYLKHLRKDTTQPLVFYKRLISQGVMPHPAPPGTIVEGHYKKFGMPVPPNLVEYQSRSFSSHATSNPYITGGGLNNADYAVTRSGSVTSGGSVSGSNSLFIGKNNLPTNNFGFDLEVTPSGFVNINSYQGSRTTSSDTHNHKVDGDSASGVGGGSSGGDRVLNNDDGSRDLDVYTESDTHSHTIDLTHNHGASFSGTTETHSGNIQLNTSQSQIDVRSKSLTVERYFVAW